jgi:hypothetical protein
VVQGVPGLLHPVLQVEVAEEVREVVVVARRPLPIII